MVMPEWISCPLAEVRLDVSADLADLYGITEKEALNRIYNSGYNIYTTLDPKIQELTLAPPVASVTMS